MKVRVVNWSGGSRWPALVIATRAGHLCASLLRAVAIDHSDHQPVILEVDGPRIQAEEAKPRNRKDQSASPCLTARVQCHS